MVRQMTKRFVTAGGTWLWIWVVGILSGLAAIRTFESQDHSLGLDLPQVASDLVLGNGKVGGWF